MLTHELTRNLPTGLGGRIIDTLFPNDPLDNLSSAERMVEQLGILQAGDAEPYQAIVATVGREMSKLYGNRGFAEQEGFWGTFTREGTARNIMEPIDHAVRLLTSVYGSCATPAESQAAVRVYAATLKSPGNVVMSWADQNLVFNGTRWRVWTALSICSQNGITHRLDEMVKQAKSTGVASVLAIDGEWERVHCQLDGIMWQVVRG